MAAIQFTTLIRLPFVRGGFVDPQQADWSAAKDHALWKVISKSSKTSDLNWVELATRFQVPSAFLIQQASWLYERHLDHVRTQMKKVGSTNAPGTSSYGSAHGGIPMRRDGSGGSRNSRTPSAMSVRPRDSPVPRTESATAGTVPLHGAPSAPPLSRTPSTNTITQSRTYNPQAPVRTGFQRPAIVLTGTKRLDPASIIHPPKTNRAGSVDANPSDIAESSPSSSSDSDSDSDPHNPAHRSQLFKRPPRFRQQRPRELLSHDERLEEGEDVEDSATALLPFARVEAKFASGRGKHVKPVAQASSSGQRQQPPIRGADARQEQEAMSQPLDVSSSMASSASDAPRPSRAGGPGTTGPGPLSPRHRAGFAKLNDKRTGPKSKRDGSEGTPSMGSSFSDIDDAGISQSALEEALLSNIQQGRMSTLSQLRSRYL